MKELFAKTEQTLTTSAEKSEILTTQLSKMKRSVHAPLGSVSVVSSVATERAELEQQITVRI